MFHMVYAGLGAKGPEVAWLGRFCAGRLLPNVLPNRPRTTLFKRLEDGSGMGQRLNGAGQNGPNGKANTPNGGLPGSDQM